jgi:hypothetical protein
MPELFRVPDPERINHPGHSGGVQAEMPPAVAFVEQRRAECDGSELIDRPAGNGDEEAQHPRMRQRDYARMRMRKAQKLGMDREHCGRGGEPRQRESHESERQTTLRGEPAARLGRPGS